MNNYLLLYNEIWMSLLNFNFNTQIFIIIIFAMNEKYIFEYIKMIIFLHITNGVLQIDIECDTKKCIQNV